MGNDARTVPVRPAPTPFPADRIAARIGQFADALVADALDGYVAERKCELGEGFDVATAIRKEVNPALKPYGMQILVTEHDDGGVRTSTYALWFPPFARPTWGDR